MNFEQPENQSHSFSNARDELTHLRYLDFIPIELVFEILFYLDIDDIIIFDKTHPQLNIRKNKVFWINRIIDSQLDDFLFLLDSFYPADYLTQYQYFKKTNESKRIRIDWVLEDPEPYKWAE